MEFKISYVYVFAKFWGFIFASLIKSSILSLVSCLNLKPILGLNI